MYCGDDGGPPVAQSPLQKRHATPVEQLAAVQRELDDLCVLRFDRGLDGEESARYDALTQFELVLLQSVERDHSSASVN